MGRSHKGFSRRQLAVTTEIESELKRLEPCEPPKWVIVCNDGKGAGRLSFERHEEGGILYWKTEADAKLSISSMFPSVQRKRIARRLTFGELDLIDEPLVLVNPKSKEEVMPKKTTSVGCLVDIFEDYEQRKFAIATKASTEEEFLVEISQAMGTSTPNSWEVRLREMLPLIVDMCCKYRGYKAERVLERRELVAGDLDIPERSQS